MYVRVEVFCRHFVDMTQKREDKKDPRGLAAGRSQPRSGSQGQNSGQGSRSRSEDKGSPEGDKPVVIPRKIGLAVGREPTFYIGGYNGVALVEDTLTELGWKRINDRHNAYFKIKWVECKTQINYNAFKEGDQLVNHIPNCNLLTNKMGLLDSLQAYERLNCSLHRREMRLKMEDFIPPTYRLDDPAEREQFLQAFQYSDIWICKPTGMNQGKGIFLVRDIEDFKVTLMERDERMAHTRTTARANMGRIIQKYIKYPLLLEGRKFDIRAYMLLSSTSPYLVLYHKGYVRLSLIDYDIRDDNLTAHLTNQFIQKKDPSYKEDKESTAWSMDKFNDYINEWVAPDKGLERDWVNNTLPTRMKQIMMYCFHSVKNRLHCKVGYFDLYGLDFMIDEEMKIFLIEVNVNPSLATNCEALKEVIPTVVRETLYITLECFEKLRRGHPLLPLHSLKTFEVLHNGCPKSGRGSGRTSDGSTVRSPVRTGYNSPIRRPAVTNGQGQPSQSQGTQGRPAQGQNTQGQSSQSQHVPQGQMKSKTIKSPKTRVIKVGMNPKLSPQVTLPINPVIALPGLRGAMCVSKLDSGRVSVVKSLSRRKKLKLKMTHTKGQLTNGANRIGTIQEELEEESEGQEESDTEESSEGDSTQQQELDTSDTCQPTAAHGLTQHRSLTDNGGVSGSDVLVLPKVTVSTSGTLLTKPITSRKPDRGS